MELMGTTRGYPGIPNFFRTSTVSASTPFRSHVGLLHQVVEWTKAHSEVWAQVEMANLGAGFKGIKQ